MKEVSHHHTLWWTQAQNNICILTYQLLATESIEVGTDGDPTVVGGVEW